MDVQKNSRMDTLYHEMHSFRRILVSMEDCEADQEAEYEATFMHDFVKRIDEIKKLAKEFWPQAAEIDVKVMYRNRGDLSARALQVILYYI